MDERTASDEGETHRLVTDGGDAPTMVVVGDSVAWGQGLRHDQKYASLFYERLTGGTDSLDRDAIKAHSGAIIGTESDEGNDDATTLLASANALGGTTREGRHEFPYSYLTVREQVERIPNDYTDAERPNSLGPASAYDGGDDSVDVVVVTAGINDVGGGSIANPLADPESIEATARESCYVRMKRLLEETRRAFPEATIVVTGYHLVMGTGDEGTEIELIDDLSAGLQVLFGLFSIPLALVIEVLFGIADVAEEVAAAHFEYFYQQSAHYLRKAVTEVDNANPDATVVFASPDYDRANAANADDPWVWPVGSTGEPSVYSERTDVCQAVDDDTSKDVSVQCSIAPSLHPNPKGADEMARAMERRYDEATGERSLRSVMEKLSGDGGRVSVRESLERYAGVDGLLEPEAGLRSCLRQTTVDSVRVRIRTSDESTAGNQSSTVNLDLGGFSHELDDTVWQKVFEHSNFDAGALDDFSFDPLLVTDRTERDPLRLWEIDGATLEQDQPDFFEWFNDQWWKIESFELFLNGIKVVENGSFELDGDESQTFDYPVS